MSRALLSVRRSEVGAVFVGDPDVAEIAEGDLTFGIGGMAEHLHLAEGQDREQGCEKENFAHG